MTVEAALIVPVLLLLVFGMIELGLMLKDSSSLNQVAREAARTYAVDGTPDVVDLATKYGLPNPGTVTVTSLTPGAAKGDQVSITLTYEHTVVVWGSTKTLTATMVWLHE